MLASNFRKLYFLTKTHNRLSNVPDRPVISNCGTPTKKASEFLASDYHLKAVMRRSWSYVKDSGDFIEKIERISNVPDDAILVTADIVALYPSIPHELGLKALENLHRVQHPILSKWLNLYFRIIILNLMARSNNKFLVLL